MPGATPDRTARIIALAAPAALLLGAYISQYCFGLFPCEMCWWQRYAHFAALGFAILAFVRPSVRVLLWLAALAIAVSGFIGGFHAGVEYGWWEGVTSCAVSFDQGGADPLESILNAPLVRCDVAPWTLMGISLAGWNFLASTGAALLILRLLGRAQGASS